MTETTINPILVELPATQRSVSTKTNSSKVSRVTHALKKTSTSLEQRLKNLKTRVSKLNSAHQESEKRHTTPHPQVVEEPRDEGIGLEVNKQDDVRKNKREARRAKWAVRRASLKRIAKKAGKAIALSGACILGFIFGPILIVIDLVLVLVGLVLKVIVELAELVCLPFYICFAWD